MRARAAHRVSLAVLACAVVGCTTLFEPSPTREEQRAYAAAEAARRSGPRPGREAFESFLERYPDGELAPNATLALAEIARGEGDLDEAARRYAEVIRSGEDASDRARVYLATLELERGDRAAARQSLDRARLSRLSDAELRTAYRAFAESSEGAADRLRWLAMLRGATSDATEAAAVDAQIDAVAGDLAISDLESAVRQVGDRPPAGHLYLALGERALAEGQLDVAREALDEARRRPLAPRYAARLAALETRLRTPEIPRIPEAPERLLTFAEANDRAPDLSRARGALGVVVPLTGSYARFGQEVLHGVLLASGTFHEADGTSRPQIRIEVRDTGGDPERAAAAVRELADDPEVVAIVGPLVSASCEAAAREADSVGIPLVALTARDEVTRDRSWVFRVKTRPAEEAQALADRAIELGADRFAILYPNDPYGIGLRGLFWDAVEARGGRVVAVASYDPKATDFGEPIRRLVGYTMLDGEEKALVAKRDEMLRRAQRLPADQGRAMRARARSITTADGRPIPPIVDFDALFIPASHEDVVLIAPQLAFHEVTGARLLGAEGWYGEDLVRLGGDPLEGALIAADFYPESPVPYVRSFRERFEATFGSTPDSFAAQGYDAAGLVLAQLAKGRDDRGGVRTGLLATESFPGVSGVLTMRSDGNAAKRPYMLGIEQGRIVHYAD